LDSASPTKRDGRIPFPPTFTVDVASHFEKFRRLRASGVKVAEAYDAIFSTTFRHANWRNQYGLWERLELKENKDIKAVYDSCLQAGRTPGGFWSIVRAKSGQLTS